MLGSRTHKMFASVYLQFSCKITQLFQLLISCQLSAYNQHLCVFLHHGCRLQQNVWPLKWIKSAHIKQHWSILLQLQFFSCLPSILWDKPHKINAARNHLYLACRGSTVAYDLLPLIASSSDNAVST